jgi:hypothetical protein
MEAGAGCSAPSMPKCVCCQTLEVWPRRDNPCHATNRNPLCPLSLVQLGWCLSFSRFARCGDHRLVRRQIELRARVNSSFRFDVQCSVAKINTRWCSWLRYIWQLAEDDVHLWPFDGTQRGARGGIFKGINLKTRLISVARSRHQHSS